MLPVAGPPSAPPNRPERATPGLAVFLALLGLYAGVHVALRLTLSPVVAIDDAREALLSQTFELGYQPRQPPLYNWLVWGSVRVLGISTAVVILCRYATLAVAYVFLYLSATHALGHRVLALLAAFSLILMGPFNWDAHEELTHSLAALAAASATFYALLRVERSGSVLAYLGFGAALAAGFLAKFSYGFFAGSLLVAALATPEYRRRILSARFGLTVATTLALCLPYALWFVDRDLSITRMYTEEVRREATHSYLGGVFRGFYHLGRMLFIYLMPFALVFLAVFWRAWQPRPSDGSGRVRRLLAGLFLAEGGLVVGAILAGSLTYLRFRWLMPAFFLAPLLAFAWVDSPTVERRRLVRYAAGLLGVEALVLLALTANVLRGDALGEPTRLNAPYDAVATALASAGFSRGTIAAGEGPLAGNLRLRFPDSRVIRLTNPDYLPPTAGDGQCLAVWEVPSGDHPAFLAWVASVLGARVDGEPVRTVSARYHHARERTLRVDYVFLPAGRGDCR
jgi:4-amino-4-deoxy-L-arabinose transferase-like glycosyltransferase